MAKRPLEFTNQVQHRTKVLRWKEEVMSSWALESGLRFTVCMQTVNLCGSLPALWSETWRRSVGELKRNSKDVAAKKEEFEQF